MSFIEEMQLEKKDDKFFQIYENKDYVVILSGKGELNSAIATTYLSKVYEIQDCDVVVNFGTCASKTTKIGELIEFGQVVSISTNQKFILSKNKEKLFCSSKEILNTNHKYEFVDMESAGFYVSSKKFFKNIKIIKVVSDNFSTYDEALLKNLKINWEEICTITKL